MGSVWGLSVVRGPAPMQDPLRNPEVAEGGVQGLKHLVQAGGPGDQDLGPPGLEVQQEVEVVVPGTHWTLVDGSTCLP